MSKAKDKFVLVELTDPHVVRVLTELRALLGRQKKQTGIHITIRGPYGTEPRKLLLKRLEERVRGEPLLISGVGRFQNAGMHIVYLKVTGKFLKALWWKPDYPTHLYGFNPHVTIYEGEDADVAEVVFKFLKSEQIELLCFDYMVRLHDRRVPEFLFHAPRPDEVHGAEERIRWGRVKSGLLKRAAEISRLLAKPSVQQRLF